MLFYDSISGFIRVSYADRVNHTCFELYSQKYIFTLPSFFVLDKLSPTYVNPFPPFGPDPWKFKHILISIPRGTMGNSTVLLKSSVKGAVGSRNIHAAAK